MDTELENQIIAKREHIVKVWFEMWLQQKDLGIDDIFIEEAIYIESWCPQYNGRAKIKHWFTEWNTRGKVLVWDIKQFFHKDKQTAVEWLFKNEMNNGVRESFDGISIIEWTDDNKIIAIKEFGCNLDRYDPYQDSLTPKFKNDKLAWF